MSENDGLPEGIETTDLTSGWIATIHNGDGTSTEFWAPTEQRAIKKAENADTETNE